MDDHENRDLVVDLREETLVTRHPGYVSTERVVHDIAAERRIARFQIFRIFWGVLALLEILLAIRFGLRMIAANPDSGFALFLYGFTGMIVGPFNNLTESPIYAGYTLEITTLIAMAFYMLIFWGIAFFIRLLMDRPGARIFTRTTQEETPGVDGSMRTTHMTISSGNIQVPAAMERVSTANDATSDLPKLLIDKQAEPAKLSKK